MGGYVRGFVLVRMFPSAMMILEGPEPEVGGGGGAEAVVDSESALRRFLD